MSLLIKNGEIVTAGERYVADVLCVDGMIDADWRGYRGGTRDTEVVDATGKYVFPGFIDPHTHIYLPFMGTFAKDDLRNRQQGGPDRRDDLLLLISVSRLEGKIRWSLATWNSKSDGQSACDFTYHMAVTRYDEMIEKQLRDWWREQGITSFKVFLAYKGASGGYGRRTLSRDEAGQGTGRDRDRPLRESPTWCWSCRSSCSRKARRGRSGTTTHVRRGWRRKGPAT